MNLRQRLISASALNVLDYGLKIGVVLVVSPFLINRLGKEDYGLWVLLLSILGYLDLLDLGINQTAVRYLSRRLGADQQGEQASIFSFFKRWYQRIALAALVITGLATFALPWWVEDPVLLAQVRPILLLGGLMMSASFFLRVYATLLKSRVLYHKLIIAGMARLLVYTVLMVAVLWNGGGLVALALAWVAGLVVEQAMIWWQARSLVPASAGTGLPKAEQREIRGFAAKTFGGVAAGFMRDRVDTQVLAAHLGTVAVTHYAVGSRLMILFSELINAVFGGHFLAAFAQVHARDGAEAAGARLLATLRLSAPIALMGGISVFLLGPAFIDCWLGAGFEQAHLVVQILALPVSLTLMLYPVGPYLGSLNRHGALALISLLGGALNLLASLILVRWLGFIGPVVATAGELLVTATLFWPWLITRHGDLQLSIVFKLLARTLLALLPVALLAGWTLQQVGLPQDFPTLLLHAMGLTAALTASTWFLAFNASLRKEIQLLIRRSRRS